MLVSGCTEEPDVGSAPLSLSVPGVSDSVPCEGVSGSAGVVGSVGVTGSVGCEGSAVLSAGPTRTMRLRDLYVLLASNVRLSRLPFLSYTQR